MSILVFFLIPCAALYNVKRVIVVHISEVFPVLWGTRQGAIPSPTFANILLHLLLEALDDSSRGAFLHQHHVPGVCYADDLLLLAPIPDT